MKEHYIAKHFYKVVKYPKFASVLLLILCFIQIGSAQNNKEFHSNKTRILFVLDASGSMNQKWGSQSKFQLSKELIYHLADSLQQANEAVEFGVRVFGHQFPRSAHNCLDSKLEVPFTPKNAAVLRAKLSKITPQGYSPIAYSLLKAAEDFPMDTAAVNAIILVTDGEEKCEGDPCLAAKELAKKKVALKPFIIGLNLPKDLVMDFNCVGKYFDAHDSNALGNVLGKVVGQAMRPTTAQINLLDIKGEATVTNIAFTMYDHFSGAIRYNFIHTLNEQGNPDTLFLNPTGVYDIEVHSIPPIVKRNVELIAGVHNIIPIVMPIGYLHLKMDNARPADEVQCVVREAYSSEILYVQDLNDDEAYLRGDFDLDFLTLPRFSKKLVYVKEEKERQISIPKSGKVQFVNVDASIASIYEIKMDEFHMVIELDKVKEKDTVTLLPGRYAVVFLPKGSPKSDYTKTMYFDVSSEKMTTLNLR